MRGGEAEGNPVWLTRAKRIIAEMEKETEIGCLLKTMQKAGWLDRMTRNTLAWGHFRNWFVVTQKGWIAHPTMFKAIIGRSNQKYADRCVPFDFEAETLELRTKGKPPKKTKKAVNRREIYPFTCATCGKKGKGKTARRKYCSQACFRQKRRVSAFDLYKR